MRVRIYVRKWLTGDAFRFHWKESIGARADRQRGSDVLFGRDASKDGGYIDEHWQEQAGRTRRQSRASNAIEHAAGCGVAERYRIGSDGSRS